MDIQVDEEGEFGGNGSMEWEVVEPNEAEAETEAAAAGNDNNEAEPPPSEVPVAAVEQEGQEEEEDKAWGRWKKELACLAEMGFETRLDACVEALERRRPTDAEVRRSRVVWCGVCVWFSQGGGSQYVSVCLGR